MANKAYLKVNQGDKDVMLHNGIIPVLPKCAKPAKKYENGMLLISCETEGVDFGFEITPAEINKINDSKIEISNTYTVTVQARKSGYNKSDKSSIEIHANSGIRGDLTDDGKVDVADHVELSKIIMGK